MQEKKSCFGDLDVLTKGLEAFSRALISIFDQQMLYCFQQTHQAYGIWAKFVINRYSYRLVCQAACSVNYKIILYIFVMLIVLHVRTSLPHGSRLTHAFKMINSCPNYKRCRLLNNPGWTQIKFWAHAGLLQ